MPSDRSVVESQIERVELRPFTLDGFHRRRQRRERNRRIGSAVVGLVVAGVAIGGLLRALSPSTVPADELGIFAPVAGRILYVNEGIDHGFDPGLWAVDPSGPSDTTAGPSVADDVVSTLVRLGLEGATPLGWSSDGTELLFERTSEYSAENPFPKGYLSILHADGSETRLNSDPVGIAGATISPDGTRVVFAAKYDESGLFVVDAEGGRPVRLPIPEGGAPTFSPDGTQIAYLVDGEHEAQVWVSDADGRDAHEILADEATVLGGTSGLEWSPAGDRLAIGLGGFQGSDGLAIYTFAPDGSDFTQVITGGISPYWSPDGSQIAYTILCEDRLTASCPEGSILRSQFDDQPTLFGGGSAGLAIADADGSNVREFGFAASGPWHPITVNEAPVDEHTPSPGPSESADQALSRFVGAWASTELEPYNGRDGSSQTMTIRAAEDGDLDIALHDESSWLCSDTPTTMTGIGRLEDATTLVVPSPVLACVDGRDPSAGSPSMEEGGTSYTLVLDPATDRLFDNLGVAWHRGATPESESGTTTDTPGTYAVLRGEVTFHADRPWNDHVESYIDPRLFFLVGPDDAEITILANPLPEASCAASPRVPASAEAVVRAIRSNPDIEATVPVAERVGGIDALRLDVAAVPGASTCPFGRVPVVSVSNRGAWGGVEHGDLARLYVLDLPGGSARALVIKITAPEAAFGQAVEAAVPVVDSFEFRTP